MAFPPHPRLDIPSLVLHCGLAVTFDWVGWLEGGGGAPILDHKAVTCAGGAFSAPPWTPWEMLLLPQSRFASKRLTSIEFPTEKYCTSF